MILSLKVGSFEETTRTTLDIKNATRALQRRREIKKAIRKYQCTEADLLAALDTIDRDKEELS
jgi:hypothetical protein